MDRSTRGLWLILLLAIVLRLGLAGWWQWRHGETFVFGDSQSYWTLGQSLAAGEPYRFGASAIFRTPGYPALLAPIFWLAGPTASVFWGRAENALWGTVAVAAVAWLGRRLGGPKVGLWAAAAAALYPEAIASSVLVLSDTPFAALMVVQLALWVVAWQTPQKWPACGWALLAGAVAGAASLVRPSWLLFTPFALFVSLAFEAERRRQAALGTLLLVGLLVVMLPWWIRNAAITGHFVPTSLQVGASLYDGLNPQATGASQMRLVDEYVQSLRETGPSSVPAVPAEGEYELDQRLRRAAVDWAAGHPGQVLQLAVVKLGRMWNLWPNEPAFAAWPVRVAVVFTFAPIALLGIMALARTTARGWPYRLCWLPALYLSGIHMLFVGSLRYRMPAMLPWMVLAAWWLLYRKTATAVGLQTKEGTILSSGG